MATLPGVPDFEDVSDVKKWLEEQFAGNYALFGKDLETRFRKMLTEEHAAILVPQTTIDAAHAQKNLTAASAGAIFTAFSLEKTGSTTANTNQTIVDYQGRGVLTKFGIAEVTAGLTNPRTFGAKITIDGNVIYDVSNALTRESSIRVIVGNLFDVSGTNIGWTDGVPGIPFNSQCKLEYVSDGTRTLSYGYKISKKA